MKYSSVRDGGSGQGLGSGSGLGGLVLVLVFALIQVPQGLWDGHASVRNAYRAEVQLEIEKIDEKVKADDDGPTRPWELA